MVYFHNLAYDWTFIAHKLNSIANVIKKGSKIYSASGTYKGKFITFKDSLPIFMCKLSGLPKSFNLKGIQKEIFPYKYYTLERLENNIGIISEAGENEDKKWTEEDYKLFNHNIDLINGRINENEFDMYKYAEFYCEQDVRILRLSFEKLKDS